MSKVRLKFAVQEMFGTLYEVETHPSHEKEEVEETRVKRAHTSSGKASEAQKAQRQRFKEAVAYAQGVLADPELCAVYEARAKRENKPAFVLATSDYLHGKNLLLEERGDPAPTTPK